VISGIKWALFYALRVELNHIQGFSEPSCIEGEQTIYSSSAYYEVKGVKEINPLRAVNKLYNTYCVTSVV